MECTVGKEKQQRYPNGPYDTDQRAIGQILKNTGFLDCFRERHPITRAYSFYQQQLPTSRIDTIWINGNLQRDLGDDQPKAAIAKNTGGLTIDHRPVAIRINLTMTLDTTHNLTSVIAMGLAQRPRTISLTTSAEKKWKAVIKNDETMASLTENFMRPTDDTVTLDTDGNVHTIKYGDNNSVAKWTQISRWLNTLDYPHWTLTEYEIATAPS